MKITIFAINSKFVHSSLAVWYLASALKSNSPCTEARVIEGTINESEDALFDRIRSTNPDLVAFSTYIWNLKTVLKLSERAKREIGCEVLLGGPEVSYNPKEIFDKYDFIDYIISGEGEMPIVKLCNGEDKEKIEGLCFKKCEGVVIKEPFVGTGDPPNPYLPEYFDALNGRIAYIETSRGCPFRCAFCLSGRCGGVRFFDLKTSKENIVLLANSGTQTVKFIDRTFNADKKRAREILSFIINEYGKRIPKGVCFHFEIEGALIDEESLMLLKAAPVGLIQFEIGMQSFNSNTLNSINRKVDLNKLCSNIEKIISLGTIHVHLDLIVGLPHEGYDSFKESFNGAYRLKPHMLQIGFLKLLHGSDLRENEGYEWGFIDTPPYEIASTPWLGREKMKRLHSFEDVFEKMYNSSRFTLTCEYLEGVYPTPFDMYEALSDFAIDSPCENTLDSFTEMLFNFYSAQNGVDRMVLRDKLAIDRLASNRMGALPEFLKVPCPKMKQYLNELEKNEATKRPKNVKRAATLLLSENRLAYVDYEQADYLTNRFLVKFTEIPPV